MVLRIVTLLTILLSCFVLEAEVFAQAPEGTLQLDSYLDWETVSNPRVSPDGSQILYSRGWVDKMRDRRSSSVWVMNKDGSRNRLLVNGSNATWSPDGSRIAFMADGDGGDSQIFVRWMDAEGATTQVTRTQNSASNLRWSPDGTQIAFTMTVDTPESEWAIELSQEPDGADWVEGPKVVDRLSYRRDRRGYIDEGYTHVFTVPAEAGTPKQISDGDWNHSAAEWMPDGASLIFSSLRVDEAEHEWRESEIYKAVLATGAIHQLTDRAGPDSGPVPSPDGQYIAYQGQNFNDDTYRENELYVMSADGSNPRSLGGEMGRSLGNITWASDGSGVYFNVSMHGTQNLWFAPLNGQPHEVTSGNHMLSMASIDKDGTAVGTLSSYHKPADVVSFGTGTGDPIVQLTRVNDDILNDVTLGQVEEIWYKSVDNFDIMFQLYSSFNFQIVDVEIHTGSGKKPSATVTLTNTEGKEFTETCDGNGPVDAVCRAIANVAGIHPTLEEYSVRSITGELDAVGDVTVRLNHNDQLYSGRGADTDIILASAKAYTNAFTCMVRQNSHLSTLGAHFSKNNARR